MKCNQHGCGNEAAYRFTWPGDDEKGICEAHAPKMMAVASALGLHLQMIPLPANETPTAIPQADCIRELPAEAYARELAGVDAAAERIVAAERLRQAGVGA